MDSKQIFGLGIRMWWWCSMDLIKILSFLDFLISKSVACKCVLYRLTFLSSSPSKWQARATRGRENPISLMCFARFWAAGLRSLKGFSSSDFTVDLLAEWLVTDGDFLVSGRGCSGLSKSGHGFQFYTTDKKNYHPQFFYYVFHI